MQTPPGTLVGREPQIARLRTLLGDRAPSGGAVVIRGDPGTGKSALLGEAARIAETSGTLVLHAAGVEAEARMPFAGIHQLVRPVLSRVGVLADGQRWALLDAFGRSGAHPEIFLVALAVLNLLGEVASTRPVALLVDDAQWLDTATVEILAFVARRVEDDPITLIVTYRTGYEDSAGLAELPELEVGTLDRESAITLLATRFPDLDGRARDRVLDYAAGNPLALLELPHVINAAGTEPGREVALTRRLERAFAVRTSALPPETRGLLLIAALDERASVDEVIAAAARIVTGRAPTLDDLVPAEAARLVVTDGRVVRFRHPLMSSAVRQGASPTDRQAAHAALAAVLDDAPDRQVWHRAACAVGPDERLAEQLDASAARLRQRHGTALAASALRRATELSATPEAQGRRLVAAAELALQLGKNEEVVELLDQAEPLELDVPTRQAMLWLREALAEASGTATVVSTLAVAEQLIAAGDLRLGMQALFTAAVRCYMFKVDDALPAAVIRAAGQVGLPAHDATFAAIRALADPARHAAEVADAVAGITPEAVMRTAPDAGAAADSMHLYALALTCVAEFRLGVGFQDQAIAAFRAQGRLGLLSRALGSHSVVRLDLADWSLATQAADECLRLTGYTPGVRGTATDGERVLNAGSCLLVLATVAANRGKPALAEQRLEEAVRVFGAAGSSYMLALVQAARTSVAMAEGRPAEAFQHAQRIFDPADVACHWPVSRGGPVLRDLADAATASGNTAQAKALLAGIDRNTATAEARGALAHADAVLAHEGAEQLFRAALAAAPSAVFFQARLHLAFGLWLRRQRRQMEARPYLRSATDGFDAIGAAPWAERARQELRASGETLRRGGADIRDELSPQEMQIAQLAAQGLTNREIGARLFVSHRTIGSHLYKIFPKLGIRSRAELAAALAQTPAAAAATQGSAGEQPVAPRA